MKLENNPEQKSSDTINRTRHQVTKVKDAIKDSDFLSPSNTFSSINTLSTGASLIITNEKKEPQLFLNKDF